MAKEQDCFNTFPGYVTNISREALNSLLARTEWYKVRINGLWCGGKDDNQRRTSFCYIYADDNLLGGR